MTRYTTIAFCLAASPALAHHEEVQSHVFNPALGLVMLVLASGVLMGLRALKVRAEGK